MVKHVMRALMRLEMLVPDSGWVAFGGVVVGAVGKGLWDVWLARGKVKADREAREDARSEKHAERRADLQRQTLLAAQDQMMALAMVMTKIATHEDRIPGQSGAFSPAVMKEFDEAMSRLRVLSSRVADDELRQGVREFQAACGKLASSPTDEEGTTFSRNLPAFTDWQARAGRAVRKLDEA